MTRHTPTRARRGATKIVERVPVHTVDAVARARGLGVRRGIHSFIRVTRKALDL